MPLCINESLVCIGGYRNRFGIQLLGVTLFCPVRYELWESLSDEYMDIHITHTRFTLCYQFLKPRSLSSSNTFAVPPSRLTLFHPYPHSPSLPVLPSPPPLLQPLVSIPPGKFQLNQIRQLHAPRYLTSLKTYVTHACAYSHPQTLTFFPPQKQKSPSSTNLRSYIHS